MSFFMRGLFITKHGDIGSMLRQEIQEGARGVAIFTRQVIQSEKVKIGEDVQRKIEEPRVDKRYQKTFNK